jgi:3-hydroxybutyryl-CoA dehydrogenase
MPLVEVVMGKRSRLDIAEQLVALLRACGKVPVLVRKDVPGQLGNRINHAIVRECVHIVAEGIATAEDVTWPSRRASACAPRSTGSSSITIWSAWRW